MCKDWLRKSATINTKKKGQVEKIRMKKVVRVQIKVFKSFPNNVLEKPTTKQSRRYAENPR